MAYEMVMPYHLHMPSYFLETFTEYPPCKLILYGGFFVFGAWQISISLATDFTFIKIILFSDKFPEVSLTYYLFH